MRNLFVCHAQSHLILSCGLAQGRFSTTENELILFQDFLLTNELEERLNVVFNKVIILQGIYPKELNTFKSKLKNYPVNDRKMRDLMRTPYENVFTVCDTIYPDQKCMQIAYKLNKNTSFCWLEDGILAYYANVIINKGLTSNSFLKKARSLYFKYIKGLGSFYNRDFAGFGGSIYNRTIYCLYPNAVREPYKSQRNVIGIQNDEYLKGLNALYQAKELPITNGDTILLLDKIDTYMNPETVKEVVGTFVRSALAEGSKVYCKYHPRETEHWEVLNDCESLDNKVGAESMYLSLASKAKDITVVGIKSAGIMTAHKLGFKTKSLFASSGEENPELQKFFNSIGIEMIYNQK